ncbi:carbohydrate sulfotransferase 4-like isoform X6 [Penaeus chinensis]|uniref:carbohydrate sulfotransferase 4-like isoform X6 n=1 Tax=Penaeus chinensis TaxID=139456 RepID=UPI001FB7ED5D|nr:carbohydrate sulfotransferase 4-like isoform X6 [Penaeus chinensis]
MRRRGPVAAADRSRIRKESPAAYPVTSRPRQNSPPFAELLVCRGIRGRESAWASKRGNERAAEKPRAILRLEGKPVRCLAGTRASSLCVRRYCCLGKSPTGVTAAASRELIQRMLECNFSQEWSAWAKTRKNVWKPENHEVCEGHRGSDYHQCLREICQSSVFKVIKTIKLRVWWAGEVLLGGGVKVVHLVRDPRGSFTSLARLSMVQADYKMWCPRILQDLEMVSTMRSLFPESFTSVKYEDLCRDPWGTATKLWKFISNENNTSLPVSWRTFLHRHTNTNSIKPYGTDRDTRQQIGAWREKISERMLSEIEHHCGGVIDMLGHTRFHSLTNARNSSIPLDEKSGT